MPGETLTWGSTLSPLGLLGLHQDPTEAAEAKGRRGAPGRSRHHPWLHARTPPLLQEHHPSASAHFQGPAPRVSTNCWQTRPCSRPSPDDPQSLQGQGLPPATASCLFPSSARGQEGAVTYLSTQTTHSVHRKSPQVLEQQQPALGKLGVLRDNSLQYSWF